MKQNTGTDKLAQAVTDFYETCGSAFSETRQAPWGVMKLVKTASKQGGVLVDIGAGNGRLGPEIDPSIRYIAVEPSSKLREAAQKILEQRPNTEILAGGFPDVPLGDAEADTVACLAVLHHIPTRNSHRDAVEEMARVLKPGGRAVVTVWNLRSKKFFRNKSWFERLRVWLAAWCRLSMVSGGEPGDVWLSWKAEGANAGRYVHAFTLKELGKLFDPKIWSVEKCEAWGNEGPEPMREAKNLVVVARKK